MLDPVQLRTLTAVLRTGSFAGAAAELGYTPSAVSQQISALERAADIALFERFPHRVEPTAAAVALAARADDILADLAAAELELAGLARGETGAIRLGGFPTASARIVPGALAALALSHPGLDVHLDEGEPGELAPALVDGRLDVALLYRYDLVPTDPAPRLAVLELMIEDLVVLVATGHLAGRDAPVRIAELRDERWVAPLPASDGAVNLDRLCAAARFRPRIAFRSNDYSVVRGLVGAGLGVALVPQLAVVSDRAVRAVSLAGRRDRRAPGRRILAACRSSDRNPALAPLLAALAASARATAARPY